MIIPGNRRKLSQAVLGAVFVLAIRNVHAAETAAPKAAAVCQGCHGTSGEGNAAAVIPRIAGQSMEYLEMALRNYASGGRGNPVMQPFARALSDTDRSAVSSYFASLNTPYSSTKSAPNAASLARGHQLANRGAESNHLQACNSCHGPDGIGVLHAAPYLAGQSSEYLAAALKSFQTGTRKSDPGKLMFSVAEQLDDPDIAAVAAYFSSITRVSIEH